jgi:hypothetical protein
MAGEPVRVAVKDFMGAPQLHINGRPQAPLSFMGWFQAQATRVVVGDQWQRVIVRFISPEDADGPAGFQIRMNKGDAGKVWIDDLRYYEGTPDNPLGPNMQPHGDFEDTGDKLPERWALFFRKDLGEEGAWAYDEEVAASGKRSLRVDVIKNAPGGFMHLYLSGCTVKEGHEYTVEVSLRAVPPRPIDLVALHQAPPWTLYGGSGDSVFAQQVRLAAAVGIHHHQFGVDLPWPKPEEQLSYSHVDKAFRDTIEIDPQAVIALRFGVAPPGWWLEAHPDERETYEDGTTDTFSVSSELWLQEMLPRLEDFVRHLEERWGDRIIIYFPCAQHTGEWFYPGVWTNHFPGFSPAARKAFQRWLQRKYGTPAELSRAWGQQISAFGDVQVPTVEQRLTATLGEFFHPMRDRFQVDYFDFLNDAMADAMEKIAATIKHACAGRKAVMFFYGYLHELAACRPGPNHSGHLRWSRLLKNPDIDIFSSPISYFDRQPGGTGHFMVPVDSVAAHGKLWFNEDDTRTHVTPEDSNFGRCPTLWESQGVHLRNFAQIFPRRMGCWYMDLGNAGWMNDVDLWNNIGKLRELWEQHLNDPVSFAPQIAVVADERSPLYMCSRSPVPRALLFDLRASITRIGAPVGWWLLEDFLAGKVKPAKLYVFPNAFVLTAQERQRIQKILRDQRATALWFYAPGFIDPEAGEADPAYIRDLTGITVQPLQAPVEDLMQPLPQAELSNSLTDPFGSRQKGLKTQWAVVEADGAEPFAVYASEGTQRAAAVSERDGWRSVYIAGLAAPPELLRNVARLAGVWVYCESNDVVLGDGKFLALAAASDGEKLLRLSQPATVSNCLTGKVITRGSEVRMSLKKGDTALLWIQGER